MGMDAPIEVDLHWPAIFQVKDHKGKRGGAKEVLLLDRRSPIQMITGRLHPGGQLLHGVKQWTMHDISDLGSGMVEGGQDFGSALFKPPPPPPPPPPQSLPPPLICISFILYVRNPTWSLAGSPTKSLSVISVISLQHSITNLCD